MEARWTVLMSIWREEHSTRPWPTRSASWWPTSPGGERRGRGRSSTRTWWCACWRIPLPGPSETWLPLAGRTWCARGVTRWQRALAPQLIAAVERLTGRRVRTFMSGTDQVGGSSIEAFVLDPGGQRGRRPRRRMSPSPVLRWTVTGWMRGVASRRPGHQVQRNGTAETSRVSPDLGAVGWSARHRKRKQYRWRAASS
jgi:hypothetical protein